MTDATKKQFMARVKELGATYERDGNAHTVTLPHGLRLVGGDCHDAYYHVGEPFEKRSLAWVYGELVRQLESGLEQCDDPECEYCTEKNES